MRKMNIKDFDLKLFLVSTLFLFSISTLLLFIFLFLSSIFEFTIPILISSENTNLERRIFNILLILTMCLSSLAGARFKGLMLLLVLIIINSLAVGILFLIH